MIEQNRVALGEAWLPRGHVMGLGCAGFGVVVAGGAGAAINLGEAGVERDGLHARFLFVAALQREQCKREDGDRSGFQAHELGPAFSRRVRMRPAYRCVNKN